MRLWERKLGCWILGHKLEVWQVFSYAHSRRIVCKRCQRSWGLHNELRVMVEWDDDLEQMYLDIGMNIRRWP